MLNEKQVRALKPREKEFTLSDDGQRGVGRLQIRVRPGGAKDWLYVYYLNKRRRKVGIGAYPSISLADARRKAAELSGHLSDGDDPAKIVREKRAASETSYGTLGDLIQAYTADMKERGRNTADEVMERCQRAGVAAGVVRSPEHLFDDPQLSARGQFVYLDHAEMGRYASDSNCFVLSDTAPRYGPSPLLGEHTEQVLRDLLHYSDDRIQALYQEHAI